MSIVILGNRDKRREQITVLDLSFEAINLKKTKKEDERKTLKGWLSLKGFAKLEILNCLDHQLTYLDLKECPNLIELKCNNNNLDGLNFLKTLPNPEKLEKIWIKNNPKLFLWSRWYL